jgi:class 3 adenylate cyclase
LGTTGPLFDLNQKSGIYCITFNSTNEKYIGSAINLAARLRGHRDLGQSQKWQTANHLLYFRND